MRVMRIEERGTVQNQCTFENVIYTDVYLLPETETETETDDG